MSIKVRIVDSSMRLQIAPSSILTLDGLNQFITFNHKKLSEKSINTHRQYLLIDRWEVMMSSLQQVLN